MDASVVDQDVQAPLASVGDELGRVFDRVRLRDVELDNLDAVTLESFELCWCTSACEDSVAPITQLFDQRRTDPAWRRASDHCVSFRHSQGVDEG